MKKFNLTLVDFEAGMLDDEAEEAFRRWNAHEALKLLVKKSEQRFKTLQQRMSSCTQTHDLSDKEINIWILETQAALKLAGEV